MSERLRRSETAVAALLYMLATLATTWPLALGLTRDLPWDLGDPVLNCALLERNAQRLLAGLGGDGAALRGFWDARIFHPEPSTLAYSEHLIAETLQILPVYALARNVVLAYNLQFLSTFVLSALGAFLLARALGLQRGPSFLAGLFFGFAPYRVEQFSHLQVLNSQWMPFVLLGVLRHLDRGRAAPLAWAALALAVQGLSCGYYLLFFPPFALAFGVFELARRGRLADSATWLRLAIATACVAVVTLPFLFPYLEVRGRGGILRERSEVELFSADVYAYSTAPEGLRLWGERVRAYPAPEGQLFPGVLPIALAALAILLPLRRMPRAWSNGERGWRRAAAVAGLAVFAAAALAVAIILAGGSAEASGIVSGVTIRSLSRSLAWAVAGLTVWLMASRSARAALIAAAQTRRAFWLAALAAAVLLSCGPTLRSLGQPLASGPYQLLYEHVPGFDGLRVPARFAMIAAFALSLLAGIGAAELRARLRRHRVVLAACAVLFLAESTAAPIVLNDVWAEPGLRRPPAPLPIGADTPPIYLKAAALPRDAVLIELPFGSDPYELRYMLHQAVHGLPLVNGFSGQRPRSYEQRRGPLRNLLAEPDRAWRALAESTATHAIVHEGVWGIPAKGRRVTRWLEAHGATVLGRDGGDVLLSLPR